MAYDEKYWSPNCEPACPGKPVIQEAQEAQVRCEERRKREHDSPMMYSSDDWEQRHRDYEAIEAGEKLFDPGAQTFEPGDGLMAHRNRGGR